MKLLLKLARNCDRFFLEEETMPVPLGIISLWLIKFKRVMLVMFTILMILFGYYFYQQPLLERFQQVKTQVKEKSQLLSQSVVQLNQAKNLQNHASDAAILKYPLSYYLKQIVNSANDAQLHLIMLKPKKVIIKNKTHIVPVEVEFYGSYVELVNYCLLLQKLSAWLSIYNINITVKNSNDKKTYLHALLLLQIYL